MNDIERPSKLLCLACGRLVEPADLDGSRCPHCGEYIDQDRVLALYEYAAETYYYGHQYRLAYKDLAKTKTETRYSLSFGGEAFAWVMLAVLSGVVGNAAYDVVKLVAARIREDVAAGKLPDRDYTPLLTLTDEELTDIVRSAREYHGGMDGLTQEVRHAILEEIVADTVAHEPKLAAEIARLMNKKSIKPKERQHLATLVRNAVVRHDKRVRPHPKKLQGLWSKLDQ